MSDIPVFHTEEEETAWQDRQQLERLQAAARGWPDAQPRYRVFTGNLPPEDLAFLQAHPDLRLADLPPDLQARCVEWVDGPGVPTGEPDPE